MSRLLVAVFAALSVFAGSHASAQWVRVGPWGGVSVRVPFVRVEVSPWGDTYVRAPFTRVRSPGYRSRWYRPYLDGPYFSAPVPPIRPYGPWDPYRSVEPYPPISAYGSASRQRLSPLPESDLRRGRTLATPYGPAAGGSADTFDAERARLRLRESAIRLARVLSRRVDDGDVWLEYLQPERIVEAIDSGEPTESLADLLTRFDGVVANPQLAPVYRADGFDETHLWLSRLVDDGAEQPGDSTGERLQQPSDARDTGDADRESTAPATPSAEPAFEELPEPLELPEPQTDLPRDTFPL